MPTKTRSQAQPQTPPDPLADLREPDAPRALPGEPPQEGPQPPAGGPDSPEAVLAAYQADERSLAAVVKAWHTDVVGKGALHSGGTCVCRHLARVALNAAPPIRIQPEPPADDDGQGEAGDTPED